MNDIVKKLIPSSEAHKQKFIVFASIGLLTAVVLLVMNASLIARSIVCDAALEEPFKRLDLYRTGVANYPSEERKVYLQEKESELQATFSELRKEKLFFDVVTDRDPGTVSPLKFKEALFLVKSEIKEAARKKNIDVVHDFGFSEWEKKLPPTHRLSDLFQALDVVREVGALAIDSEVHAITELTVPEIEEVFYDEEEKSTRYFRRRIEVGLVGEFSQVMRYMQKLLGSDFLFVVQSCEVVTKEAQEKQSKKNEEKIVNKSKRKIESEEIVAYIQFDQILL